MRVDKETVRKAYELGEGTYKKLSEKYEVSQGTIKSWAKQDRDNDDPWVKLSKPNTKNQLKKVESKVEVEKSKTKNKNINKEVIDKVISNKSLTDEQQLFCIYYIKCFNATKAYQKAYDCTYESANSHGYKLLSNVVVREEIQRLKQHKMNRALLSEDDIFQKYLDIAFSDVTDYVVHGVEDLPVIDNVTGRQALDEEGNLMFYKRNYIHFKPGDEVDGTLISEVSQGKDGVKVKLQDKMKALQWLADRTELMSIKDKAKLKLEQDKLDHIKNKDDDEEKPIAIRFITKGETDGRD